MEVIVYPAHRVITMNDSVRSAQAVAVSGDRIIAVGDADELVRDYQGRIDDRYGDDVILPGFVEAHAHCTAGSVWNWPYVGFFLE
ncbi:imidazolonepropionase-like domain-containing protein [uncultured Bifidobacterium sp.]|uniref:imidazolonepropionase-like domain-containing protein n=1 Tax=uncultured Bifidobacterium sp. TaxID=165187 RepID=UPI0028DD0DF5|nr:hypothetical protein [uncultured Bifidobacterium sp.]